MMILIGSIDTIYAQETISGGATKELQNNSKLKFHDRIFESSLYYSKSDIYSQNLTRNCLKTGVDISGVSFQISVEYLRNSNISDNRKMPVTFSFSFDKPRFDKVQYNFRQSDSIQKLKNNKLQIPDSILKLNANDEIFQRNVTDTIIKSNLVNRNVGISYSGNSSEAYLDSIHECYRIDSTQYSDLKPSELEMDSSKIRNDTPKLKNDSTGLNLNKFELPPDSLSSKLKSNKIINSFKKLEIGKSVIDYSDLTFKDFVINGIQAQAKIRDVFVGIATGQKAELTNNSLIQGAFASKPKYNLMMVRVGFGDLKSNHTHLTYSWVENKNQTEQNTLNYAYPSAKLLALETHYKTSKNSFIKVELAKINIGNKRTESSANPRWDSELAWDIDFEKQFEKINTDVVLSYIETGSSFANPGNNYLIRNQRTIGGKVKKKFKHHIQISTEISRSDYNKDRSFDQDMVENRSNLNISWSIRKNIIVQGSFMKIRFNQNNLIEKNDFISESNLIDVNVLFLSNIKNLKANTLVDINIWNNRYSDGETFNVKNKSYHLILNESVQTGFGHTVNFSGEISLTKLFSFIEPYRITLQCTDNFKVFKKLCLEPGFGICLVNDYSPSEKALLNVLINLKRICLKGGVSYESSIGQKSQIPKTLYANTMVSLKF